MIGDYLALKKRLKERNMEERGYLMDRQRDLQETFEPVVAGDEKMAQNIIKDLASITEGLPEINRNIEMKEEGTTSKDCEDLLVTMVLSLKQFSKNTWMIQWIR